MAVRYSPSMTMSAKEGMQQIQAACGASPSRCGFRHSQSGLSAGASPTRHRAARPRRRGDRGGSGVLLLVGEILRMARREAEPLDARGIHGPKDIREPRLAVKVAPGCRHEALRAGRLHEEHPLARRHAPRQALHRRRRLHRPARRRQAACGASPSRCGFRHSQSGRARGRRARCSRSRNCCIPR